MALNKTSRLQVLCKGQPNKYTMSLRKLCPTCNSHPVAVNYHDKEGRIHYRKLCTSCIHKGRKAKLPAPAWFKSGYRKKEKCERCGFKAKHPEQLGVFYVDGNLRNNTATNLRTICLNCQIDVYKSKLPWQAADLVPDF